jgi:hypothetical protein
MVSIGFERLEMTDEIVRVESLGRKSIAIRIHRRDDVERCRCSHTCTGWQTQEHKRQPSLFANDMVRAKHKEEM